MKMAHRILISVLLVISGTAGATTRKIPLAMEIVSMGRTIQLYHEHQGKYPQSWDELESVYPDLDARFSQLNPTKRMALITPPIELPKRYSGMAVAISRDAFRPIGWEEPSYAVAVISDKGGVSLLRLFPTTAKSVFENAGSSLPAPSGLGAFLHEKKEMTRRAFNCVAVVGITSWLLWLLIRRLKNNGSEQVVAPNEP